MRFIVRICIATHTQHTYDASGIIVCPYHAVAVAVLQKEGCSAAICTAKQSADIGVADYNRILADEANRILYNSPVSDCTANAVCFRIADDTAFDERICDVRIRLIALPSRNASELITIVRRSRRYIIDGCNFACQCRNKAISYITVLYAAVAQRAGISADNRPASDLAVDNHRSAASCSLISCGTANLLSAVYFAIIDQSVIIIYACADFNNNAVCIVLSDNSAYCRITDNQAVFYFRSFSSTLSNSTADTGSASLNRAAKHRVAVYIAVGLSCNSADTVDSFDDTVLNCIFIRVRSASDESCDSAAVNGSRDFAVADRALLNIHKCIAYNSAGIRFAGDTAVAYFRVFQKSVHIRISDDCTGISISGLNCGVSYLNI